VSQVDRQLRQFPPDIQAGSIPLDELARGKAMTKVLQARSPTHPARPGIGAYSDHARDAGEGAADCRSREPGTAFRNEKGIRPAGAESIPLLGIVLKSRTRGI
jgi:hypothetical protein